MREEKLIIMLLFLCDFICGFPYTKVLVARSSGIAVLALSCKSNQVADTGSRHLGPCPELSSAWGPRACVLSH